MKSFHHFAILGLLLCGMAMTSCEKEEGNSTGGIEGLGGGTIGQAFSVTPTSITLDGEEGSTATLTITSQTRWQITHLPDWLTATRTGGVGKGTVTLTATRNTGNGQRKDEIIVENNSEKITVEVAQNSIYNDYPMTVTPHITLSDGWVATLGFGQNVVGYVHGLFNRSYITSVSYQEAYDNLLEQGYADPVADTLAMYIDLSANTDYVFCIIPYGGSDAKRDYGAMQMVSVSTGSKYPNCSVSAYLTRYTSYWELSFSPNSYCKQYYYAYAINNYAEEFNEYSDINLAWVLYNMILEGRATPITEKTEYNMARNRDDGTSIYAVCVWAWAMDKDGAMSSTIKKVYKSYGSSNAPEHRAPGQPTAHPVSINPSAADLDRIAKSLRIAGEK